MSEFDENTKWENHSGNINIYSDLNESDIPKIIIEDNIYCLQLYRFLKPSKQTWETLNNFYNKYPNIGLRVLWSDLKTLSFYKQIPNIRNFKISAYNVKDYSQLSSNTKLKHFGIEETKSKAVDISFIKEFSELESLYVDGMKKGLDNVKYLGKLEKLTFRGVKMENLDFLSDLNNLMELNLRYGSYKNLDSVSKIKQLKSIELSRVRQIPNFNFLNSLEKLEKIEFEGMSKMEEIPNLSKLNNLKRIHIRNNVRLQNIEAVGEIPNLELFTLSFSENSKASDDKNLLNQSIKILTESKTIKYTTILHLLDKKTSEKLNEKGIKDWNWEVEI